MVPKCLPPPSKTTLFFLTSLRRMDKEKLSKLQAEVRIGGKGTPRRKKKIVNKSGQTDDKKLQSVLKKFNASPISGVEEVNMFRDDSKVLHFKQPKVQAAPAYSTFSISGEPQEKDLAELLPGILPQLGQDSLANLRKLAEKMGGASPGFVGSAAGDDDDVPSLVANFEEASKKGKAAAAAAAEDDMPPLEGN